MLAFSRAQTGRCIDVSALASLLRAASASGRRSLASGGREERLPATATASVPDGNLKTTLQCKLEEVQSKEGKKRGGKAKLTAEEKAEKKATEKLKWKKQNARETSRQWNAAMPTDFKEKLKTWPSLIQMEIDDETRAIESELESDRVAGVPFHSAIVGLRYRGSAMDPVSLTVDVTFEQTGPPVRATDRAGAVKPGSPLTLYRHDGEHLIPITDCVLLSQLADARTVVVRLMRESVEAVRFREKSAETTKGALAHDTDIRRHRDSSLFVLRRSTSFYKLTALKEWLSSWPESFVGKPGQTVLECAHRVRAMPVVYNDRVKRDYLEPMNDSQKTAVAMALNSKRPFVAIQGPPGTGKTLVVAEIIMQAVKEKQKVLVCAPSNLAVDTILSRMATGIATTRFGFAERDLLAADLRAHEKYAALEDAGILLHHLNAGLSRRTSAAQALFHNFHRLSIPLTKEIMDSKSVIFSTIGNGLVNKLLPLSWVPDLVVIDEAGQSMEVESWVPIMNGHRCVLAGDHCQLPCVVTSQRAAQAGLGVSLLEAMTREFGTIVSKRLDTQYRMNEKIMRWSSDYFYESEVIADPSVANHTLADICAVAREDVRNHALIMIDTDEASTSKANAVKETSLGHSFRNTGEAQIVVAYVQQLLRLGLDVADIGIISPYDAQVRLIRQMLPLPGLDVNSVDGFQGQEREVIIMSMVRNNRRGAIGFLMDERRLNVAVTRARRQFVCIASGQTMAAGEHLKSLKAVIEKHGVVLPAAQFLLPVEVRNAERVERWARFISESKKQEILSS